MFQARICGGKNAFYEHTPFFAHSRRYHNFFDLHFIQLALLHLKFVTLLLSAELFLQTVVASVSERTDKKTEYIKRYRQRRKHKRKDTQEQRHAHIQRHEDTDIKAETVSTQKQTRDSPWRSRCRQNTHTYLDVDMTSTCINDAASGMETVVAFACEWRRKGAPTLGEPAGALPFRNTIVHHLPS